MKAWLISVAAIIILTVIAGIILPEGKTNKLIKSIFAVVCMFVLVMPLQYIKNNGFNVSDIFEGGEFTVDTFYLQTTFGKRAILLENSSMELLDESGYKGTEVHIFYDMDKISFEIEKVYVNIANLVILENYQHININVEITNLLADNLKIKAEQIIVYE